MSESRISPFMFCSISFSSLFIYYDLFQPYINFFFPSYKAFDVQFLITRHNSSHFSVTYFPEIVFFHVSLFKPADLSTLSSYLILSTSTCKNYAFIFIYIWRESCISTKHPPHHLVLINTLTFLRLKLLWS